MHAACECLGCRRSSDVSPVCCILCQVQRVLPVLIVEVQLGELQAVTSHATIGGVSECVHVSASNGRQAAADSLPP